MTPTTNDMTSKAKKRRSMNTKLDVVEIFNIRDQQIKKEVHGTDFATYNDITTAITMVNARIFDFEEKIVKVHARLDRLDIK